MGIICKILAKTFFCCKYFLKMSHYSIVLHKGGMRFFKNGCNGGMENFLLEICEEARNGGGWFYNEGMGNFSLHSGQRGANPLFYEDPLFCLPPPPFEILSTPPALPLLPCHLQPPPHCFFCCPASLAEWVIMPHFMCYFT